MVICQQTAVGPCKLLGIGTNCPTGYVVKQRDSCTVTHGRNGRKLLLPKPGKKAICVRACSTAESCCTTGSAANGQKCDPAYTNLTRVCNTPMYRYCTKDKIFTNSRCSSWCNNNPQECAYAKRKICNDPNNSDFPQCHSWCVRNPGLCDTAATKYCQNPKYNKSQYCSCFSSPLNDNNIYEANSVPECFDKKCTSGGAYRRSPGMNIVKGGCPSIITCKQNIDVKSIDTSKIDVEKIDQKCIINNDEKKSDSTINGQPSGNGGGSVGGGGAGGGGNKSVGGGGNASPTYDSGPVQKNSNINLWIIFTFITVVIIAVLVGIIAKRRNTYIKLPTNT